MKAAIYARVSTEDQAERATIENQLYACRRYCEQRGYEVVDEYSDAGVSGSVPIEERPSGKRLLEDAEAKRFERVLVYRLDRLSRDTLGALLAYQRLATLKTPVESVEENFDDSPSGAFQRTVMMGVSELEKAFIRKRTMSGRQRRIREGKYQAPVTPYGYRYVPETGQLELDPIQAPVVKQMFAWADDGLGAKEIGNRLDAAGVESPYGNRRKLDTDGWSEGTIAKILKSPRYYGVNTYGGQEMLCPAIISRELFDRVQQSRSARKRDSKRGTKEFYLLQHLIYCRRCGSMYHCEYNAAGTKRYCCGRRRNNARREGERHKDIRWSFLASELDEEITRQVGWLFTEPERFFADIDSQLDGAKNQLQTIGREATKLERELRTLTESEDKLWDLWGKGRISPEEFDKRQASYADKKSELEERIEKAKSHASSESARERVEFLEMIADMRGKKLPANVHLEPDENGRPRYAVADHHSESVEDDDEETWHKWIRQFVSRIWVEDDGTFTLEGPGELRIPNVSLDMSSR
jgi:site-specific DNA recombinase